MNNLKNILKHSFRLLLIVVLSTFATTVASAKTISQSSNFIDDSVITYADNIYEREDYKYYLLSQEYINNGSYNYTTYHYLCLTNEKIDTTNTLNVSSSCDTFYRYYRSNSIYNIEKLNDNELNVNNSIYYTKSSKNYFIEKLLVTISIGILTFYLSYVLFKLFRG